MSELLPCPHCGEAEELYPAHRGFGGGKPYAIDCLGCGADFTPREGTDVIAAWNRRAPTKAEARIGELEKVIAGLNRQLTEQFELSTKYVARATRAEALLAQAKEVLEPFAKAYDAAFTGLGDGIEVRLDGSFELQNRPFYRCVTKPAAVRVADLRAASSFLTATGRGEEVSQEALPAAVYAPLPVGPEAPLSAGWRPISDAPRDGTMVWLLVDYSSATNAELIQAASAEGYFWAGNPLADAERAWTIGFNNCDNSGEDEWKFAGWCWSQDHFTEGRGTPVAWKPTGFDVEAE